MARRRKSQSPAQIATEAIPGLAGAIAFFVWFTPGAWVALKPYVIGGAILLVFALAFFVYRVFQRPSAETNAPTGNPMPSEPTRRRSRHATQAVPQPSAALDAAILEAMEPAVQAAPAPKAFSEESLRRMDWLGFEHLVVDLFRASGFEATKTQAGADGGVDIELRPKGSPADAAAQALVQCKARASRPVGVDKIRELLGVIASTGARKGILVTNSDFSGDARAFAQTNQDRILLGDIAWILKSIAKQPEALRTQWEAKHLKEGYDIPSCVQCEIKMKARRGPQSPFWGCPNYANNAIRCKRTMTFRDFDFVHLPPPRS